MNIVIGYMFLLLSVFSIGSVAAGFPSEFSQGDRDLVVNGVAKRLSRDHKPQYEVALYLAAKSEDAQAILSGDAPGAISIIFQDNLSPKKAKSLLLEDLFVNLDDADLQRLSPILGRLMTLAPENGFVNGDNAVFSYSPGEGTEVFLNGHSAGMIPGKDFFFCFLSQWLGPHPINRKEKMGLLGVKAQGSGT
ncbi:chalcone isomerase family protein [Pseudomonas pseudonitroreducens]|uniref:chalcone isomerase family protein n=1 Tax=Pseudomonas pseudonitroreducens TaxID=2892326 RepID=UPI001F2669E5|nr:chalcone isomerase family protein [Pseudomonas pseudonitroreducens]